MIQPTPTIAPKCRISGTAHFLVRLLCVSSNSKQKRRNVHAGRERGADGDVHSSATNSTNGQSSYRYSKRRLFTCQHGFALLYRYSYSIFGMRMRSMRLSMILRSKLTVKGAAAVLVPVLPYYGSSNRIYKKESTFLAKFF